MLGWISQFTQESENHELSLEDQVELWQRNDMSADKLDQILFSDLTPRHALATVPAHVYSDLEYFQPNDEKGRSILQSITKTQTPYGEAVLRRLMRSPLISPDAIQERQWMIRKLMDTPNLSDQLGEIWKSFQNPQDLLWFWREEDENSQTLYDLVYYQTPLIAHYMNSSESFLMATSIYRIFVSPGFAVLTPLLCFIVPYVMLRYMGLPVSFTDIFHLLKGQVFSVSFLSNKTVTMAVVSAVVWALLYGYNVYTIYQYAALTNRVSNIIHTKLQVAAGAVQASRDILKLTSHYPKNIQALLTLPNCDLNTEILLLRPTIFANPSVFRNKGCILSTFWKIKSYLPDIAKRARFIGYVDAFHTISGYLRSAEHAGLRWCYALYDESVKTRKTEKLWHPILFNDDEKKGKKRKPQPNSLKLRKKVRTIVLTGPNAAGKSTFVRTFLVNALLAQSLGVALAKSWKMKNTFLFLDTYLNVPDVEGHASLFQAEMYRCLEFLKTLEMMKKKRGGESRAILALDEVFSSTNFKEGYSAAYAIVQYLSTHFPSLLCFVTTHFHGLAELELKTKGKVRNYCLDVYRDKNGKIAGYPFKIRKGVSKDHIALDLLEKNGFSHSILQTARKIYSQLD